MERERENRSCVVLAPGVFRVRNFYTVVHRVLCTGLCRVVLSSVNADDAIYLCLASSFGDCEVPYPSYIHPCPPHRQLVRNLYGHLTNLG